MIGSLDIANLERLYAASETMPERIVGEVFARIKKRGVKPDWIALVEEDEAVARARVAPRGPLYGLPFAVKDNIDVAGMPTSCACPEFAYVADRSASVVDRLEAAGAVLIGKTNLDQFATGLNGTRSPYGIPASVFNPDYIAGGSSSGSAVAVAAGLVSFALGTDTAGSGRIPAAFNNIVGLKPSKGLISMSGVVPACRTQDAVSIFALTAADVARVASVAVAFDERDPFARRGGSGFAAKVLPNPLRVGIPEGESPFFGDLDYASLYRAAVERMSALGAEIVRVDFAPFETAAAMLYAGPWVAERLVAAGPLLERNPEALHPVLREILRGAEEQTALQAFQAFYMLAELSRLAQRQWAKVDCLLLPTAGTTFTITEVLADPIALNTKLGVYTNFVNLMDLAAIAVPAGFRPDGIPFGISLIGPSLSEGMLLTVSDALHRSFDGATLGATRVSLAATPPICVDSTPARSIEVAVVGAHLSGQPLNDQLVERGARLVETTRTAPGYRLFALGSTTPAKPGLVFDGEGRGGIEVELWQMDETSFGSFVALTPAPLVIGTLTLADGRAVKGFLCEAHAARGAEDITRFGGWRAWLARADEAQQDGGPEEKHSMRELMMIFTAIVFVLLSIGAVLARAECKSGTLVSQACTVLTEPGVQLGVLPRFW